MKILCINKPIHKLSVVYDTCYVTLIKLSYKNINRRNYSDAEIIRKAELKCISKSLIKKYHKVYEALTYKILI